MGVNRVTVSLLEADGPPLPPSVSVPYLAWTSILRGRSSGRLGMWTDGTCLLKAGRCVS